jgi:hypothetical protein
MCTDLDVGFGLIERWKATAETVCSGPPRTPPWRSSVAGGGSVAVHRVWQHRHAGEDAFYVARDLYVDPRKRVRVVSSPTGGPRLSIPRGAFRVACRPSRAWRRAPAPLTLASIKAGICFGAAPQAAPLDETPTLFVARDGADNVFHAMADVLNAYLMRRLAPYERIVFLDDHRDGPLMPLWRLLAPQPVLRFSELDGPRVLGAAAFSPPGGCCFLWKNRDSTPDECRRTSPLLEAFRAFAVRGLGLEAAASGRRIVTVIRRGSKRGGREVTRRIANEEPLIEALRAADGCFEVRAVDFAEIEYVEQMRLVRESAVLIGVHGAGLTNVMWLPPSAAVVEIFPQPPPQPTCFENIATWLGLRYAAWYRTEVPSSETRLGLLVPEFAVDVDAVVARVREVAGRTAAAGGAADAFA